MIGQEGPIELKGTKYTRYSCTTGNTDDGDESYDILFSSLRCNMGVGTSCINPEWSKKIIDSKFSNYCFYCYLLSLE